MADAVSGFQVSRFYGYAVSGFGLEGMKLFGAFSLLARF